MSNDSMCIYQLTHRICDSQIKFCLNSMIVVYKLDILWRDQVFMYGRVKATDIPNEF